MGKSVLKKKEILKKFLKGKQVEIPALGYEFGGVGFGLLSQENSW